MLFLKTRQVAVTIGVAASLAAAGVLADAGEGPVRANSHAPIGVMGDHLHKKGEFMFSYRFMPMTMKGNRIGTDKVSDATVLQVPNRFAPPPNLRIVPQDMDMNMHMFGMMWAPSDWFTSVFMLNYISKDMHLKTYSMMGNPPPLVGDFSTKTSGLGDTYVGGLFRLFDSGTHKLHLNLGVTAPTGDVKEQDEALTPMGTFISVRLPYAMQLGSGTWDIKPGLTYNGVGGNFTWGAQYMGTYRTGSAEGYTWGNRQELTAWAAYSPKVWISFSGRLGWDKLDRIDGIDSQIMGPIQTANPDLYGGERVMGYIGANLAGQSGWVRNQRLAVEYGVPLREDLNGPQMSLDSVLTLGWQYSFKGY